MLIFKEKTESCLCLKMSILQYLYLIFFLNSVIDSYRNLQFSLHFIYYHYNHDQHCLPKCLCQHSARQFLSIGFNKVIDKLSQKRLILRGHNKHSYETIYFFISRFSEVWDWKFIMLSYYKRLNIAVSRTYTATINILNDSNNIFLAQNSILAGTTLILVIKFYFHPFSISVRNYGRGGMVSMLFTCKNIAKSAMFKGLES